MQCAFARWSCVFSCFLGQPPHYEWALKKLRAHVKLVKG